jgi:septal ring factor EnvC (AmiA/AmiB activator)
MDADLITLPNGDSIPSSPQNRDVARRLWAEDNMTTPAVNTEINAARFKTETERENETLKTEINNLRTENLRHHRAADARDRETAEDRETERPRDR